MAVEAEAGVEVQKVFLDLGMIIVLSREWGGEWMVRVSILTRMRVEGG